MGKSTATTDEPADGARSFTHMLSNLAEGMAAQEISREFWQLTSQLRSDALSRGETGESKGKLQITLSLEVNAKGEAEIGWDLKATPPKKRRLKAAAWVLRNGNVTFEVPKQLSLGLRPVEAPPQNLEADNDGHSLPAT